MRVVVVGGGLGGLASAARLAKLGHEVTLVEQAAELGGALTFETAEGFTWDRGAHGTLLPAVLRDLFRKSGRPLERELDLEPVEVVRHHRFTDGTEVRPAGRFPVRAAGARSTGSVPGSGRSGSTTSSPTPTPGRRCAATTSRCRGRPATSPARSPACSTTGRPCTDGCAGACATSGCGRSPATASSPRATTCATCRPGSACTPTSSSASAAGPCRAGSPGSRPRSRHASRPAGSPC